MRKPPCENGSALSVAAAGDSRNHRINRKISAVEILGITTVWSKADQPDVKYKMTPVSFLSIKNGLQVPSAKNNHKTQIKLIILPLTERLQHSRTKATVLLFIYQNL